MGFIQYIVEERKASAPRFGGKLHKLGMVHTTSACVARIQADGDVVCHDSCGIG